MAVGQEEEDDEIDLDLVDPEMVQDQANLLERVQSRFDIADDLLAAMLINQVKLAELEEAQTDLLREIRDQRGPETVGEFPIEMSHTVPADTQDTAPHTVTRTPDTQTFSRVEAVSVGWPDGANNAVGIALRTGDELRLFPRNPEDDFVAFNDFSETFDLRYTLRPGEKLVAETVNLDTQNDHFVNIVPHIVEFPKDADPEDV